jgi:leader peptidase (prepilin peptidase) / N-methyltransferase
MHHEGMINGAIVAFLVSVAAVICLTDFRKMIIPDWLNALLAVTGAAVSVFLFKQDWLVVIGSAAATGLLFLTIATGYQRLRGIPGLGMGDIKFLAAASTWVGWAGVPWLLLFACMGGLGHVLLRQTAGHQVERTTRIPFGPYLSMSLLMVWSLGLSI